MDNNSAVQVFIYGANPVRTIDKDGEIWFVGKDIAEILGYSDTFGALKKHVDDEDKQNCQNDSFETPRGLIIINESGLYSLILSSKLPTAKKFKRWVTSEVLPSIRKTGRYETGSSRKRMAEFDRAMKQGKEVYISMGYKGKKLAVALDKIYKDYLGFSALEIAGIDPNEVVDEVVDEHTPRWIRRILDYVKEHGNVTPKKLAQALDMDYMRVKTQLCRMVQQGYLKKIDFGVYAMAD